MRRTVIACAACALMVILETAVCFAGSLEIEKSYPRDGETGRSPVNFAVKLYFSQDIPDTSDIDAYKGYFKMTDSEKKAQDIRIIKDTKSDNMILVICNKDLAADTEYKLTISGEFTAKSGDSLETDRTITFRTRNMSNDNTISMVMMVVMLVVVIFFSSRMMKKQNEKEEEEKAKDAKVNPYKVSKRTGKSVESVVAKTEKQKRKREAEEAKLKGKDKDKEAHYEDEDEDEYEEWLEINDNKRVKGPRPISAAGSTYRSGKKAKAEAAAKKKAAARAAGTTKPKNQSGKNKNKKKK